MQIINHNIVVLHKVIVFDYFTFSRFFYTVIVNLNMPRTLEESQRNKDTVTLNKTWSDHV